MCCLQVRVRQAPAQPRGAAGLGERVPRRPFLPVQPTETERSGRPVRASPNAIANESLTAARHAHLRYMSDSGPGIRRRRVGRSFSYTLPTGERVRDPELQAWIRSIAIPPAWTDVWISPVRNGHLLATGRDARGRKQFRYHPRWREVRDATKFARMVAFGERLPALRKRVDADLARPGLPRERVLAIAVRLLELTLMRVGNEEYARLDHSFGLTTLRRGQVNVAGTHIRFQFRGKSGKVHDVGLTDRRLAGLIRRLEELPGQDLFSCTDRSGVSRTIDSSDVNDYLRDITGEDITAKDFRTWAGTVLAFEALSASGRQPSDAAARRSVVTAIKAVACCLGNTPAVARRSYIDPQVIDAYLDGSLVAGRPDGAASKVDYTESEARSSRCSAAGRRPRIVRPIPAARRPRFTTFASRA